jgi:prepilin-type N-terminal cleavage/methylation domain-containing protein/prepilin-type processing-associated H-X9-DG protein
VCIRPKVKREGFTLIELLVVVAIIALLISILLPSLSKAREQAKAAVCGSRLKSFGQASALYEGEWKVFAPCDPYACIPESLPAPAYNARPNGHGYMDKWDPAQGYLAMYGMGIKPDIPPGVADALRAWAVAPWGFHVQAENADNPAEDMWQGFFCPSQNKRNTMDLASPELDFADQHQGASVFCKHGSGYMVNKFLRSPARGFCGEGSRLPAVPGPAALSATCDNVFSTPSVNVTPTGGSGPQNYYVQAASSDEVLNGGDTAYMCDSLDYRIGHGTNDTVDTKYDNPEVSAGLWMGMRATAVVVGARHNGKGNVLYVDSHVSRDNLVPRNRRGDLITASTFADYTTDRNLGSQQHLMPTGRRF